ncbi:MAG: HigA family addiction module antitoxin [Vulcanimicrobiaceae bacterium]
MAREIMVPKHRRPSAPGDLIREYLEDPELHLTQGDLAKRLGISRANLNAIVNGKRALTPTMAMRLQRVLGVSLQTWLNLQAAVDIYDAVHSPEARQIAKLKPLRTSAA